MIFMLNERINLIDATLTRNDIEQIVIRFNIDSNNYDLNLQSNNSEDIKKVFLELSRIIRITPIKIELKINENIDEKKDNLFIETAYEYINQLNDEMLELENDDDLKTIRNFINNGNENKGDDNNEK